MDSIDKYINEETTDRFLYKIFKRHDKDNDNYLNKEEFRCLMKNYKDDNLTESDINDVFS